MNNTSPHVLLYFARTSYSKTDARPQISELPRASRSGNEVVATHARDKSVCGYGKSTGKPLMCLVGCLGGYPACSRLE